MRSVKGYTIAALAGGSYQEYNLPLYNGFTEND